jgi:hypothetical protein
MYSNRIDLGFPMVLIEFLARVGSVISVALLVLLFQAEAFTHLRLHRGSGSGWFSFRSA